MKKIITPLEDKEIISLKVGEEVLLSGLVYTARDQAHKKLVEIIKKHKKLPIDLKGGIIYYCGPTITPKDKIIGSCGPTTSSRMDEFTPLLLRAGLKATIGKGRRSEKIKKVMRKYKAVYFLTYSGCGALLSEFVKKKRILAFPELGPEAIYELEVKNFPLIVGIDSKGRDIFNKRSKLC